MTAKDALAPKREHLAKLMLGHFDARVSAWRANPAIDIRRSEMERNRSDIERVIARMPEERLDDLIAHYDHSAGPRCVW